MKKHSFIAASIMPVIVILSYIFFTGGEIKWDVLLAIVPVGFMTAAIFHSHRRIAKNSCTKAYAWIYGFEIIFPFIWVGICSIIGLMPLATIAIFLTLPIAIACAQSMKNSLSSPEIYTDLSARTANLQVLFSILLTAAFIVGKFIA